MASTNCKKLSDLPIKILDNILYKLPLNEQKVVSLVCHRWNQIVFSPQNINKFKLNLKWNKKTNKKWSNRKYANLSISKVPSKKACKNMKMVLGKYSQSIKNLTYNHDNLNVFTGLYTALTKLPNLECIMYVFETNSKHEFPPSRQTSFPNLKKIHFKLKLRNYTNSRVVNISSRNINGISDSVTFLKKLTISSPNLENLTIDLWDTKEPNFNVYINILRAIKNCSKSLRFLKIVSDDWILDISDIDFPLLETLHIETGLRAVFFDFNGALVGLLNQFLERNQRINLTLVVFDLFINEYALEWFQIINELDVPIDLLSCEKEQFHIIKHLKKLRIDCFLITDLEEREKLKLCFRNVEFPSLTHLIIVKWRIDAETITLIARSCPNLQHFNMDAFHTSDIKLDYVSLKNHFKNLISFSGEVTLDPNN